MSTERRSDTFVCPECHRKMSVGPDERQALVRYGCVACSGVVTQEAFV